jgi:hypothetical protein
MTKVTTARIPNTPEAKLVARILRLRQELDEAERQLETLKEQKNG